MDYLKLFINVEGLDLKKKRLKIMQKMNNRPEPSYRKFCEVCAEPTLSKQNPIAL